MPPCLAWRKAILGACVALAVTSRADGEGCGGEPGASCASAGSSSPGTGSPSASPGSASTSLFDRIDTGSDGAINSRDFREFVIPSLDMDGNGRVDDHNAAVDDTSSEHAHSAVSQTFRTVDQNHDHIISPAELAMHVRRIGTLTTPEATAQWLSHAVQLPQYAPLFISNAVIDQDFPALLADRGLMLEKFGVVSELHRKRIIHAMSVRFLGVGRSPGSPSAPTLVTSKYHSPGRVTMRWAIPDDEGSTPVHAYLLQRCVSNEDGVVFPPVTDCICEYNGTALYASIIVPEDAFRYDYRIQAWNVIGSSEFSPSVTLDHSSMAASRNAHSNVLATQLSVPASSSISGPARDEDGEQRALLSLFAMLDKDGSGNVSINELRRQLTKGDAQRSSSRDKYDGATGDEGVAQQRQHITSAFNVMDENDDQKITLTELKSHWTTAMEKDAFLDTVDETVDWLKYAVELPQYEAHFRHQSIVGYDFPSLLSDDGVMLTEYGIVNGLHRDRLLLFMRRRVVDMEAAPVEPVDGLTYQLLPVGGVVLQWNRPGMRNRQFQAAEIDSKGARKFTRFRYIVKRRRVSHFSSSFTNSHSNSGVIYLNEDDAQEDARRSGGILDSWSLCYSGPQTVHEDSGGSAAQTSSTSKTSELQVQRSLSVPRNGAAVPTEHTCWQYQVVAWNHVGPSPSVFTPMLCFEAANVEAVNVPLEISAIADTASDMQCWSHMQAFLAFFGAELIFDEWLQPLCSVVDATSSLLAVLTTLAVLFSILQWVFGCCTCMGTHGKSRASDHSTFMENFNYAATVSPPNENSDVAPPQAVEHLLPALSERPQSAGQLAVLVPDHSSDLLPLEVSSSEESAGASEAGAGGSDWVDCAALPDPVSMNDEHNVDTERYNDLVCSHPGCTKNFRTRVMSYASSKTWKHQCQKCNRLRCWKHIENNSHSKYYWWHTDCCTFKCRCKDDPECELIARNSLSPPSSPTSPLLPDGVFSRNDLGEILWLKGNNQVKYRTAAYTVHWITRCISSTTTCYLTSVDPAVGGVVELSDGSSFRNPRIRPWDILRSGLGQATSLAEVEK